MGLVYRARRQEIGDLVAVKVLRDKYAADPTGAERFRREAQAAAMVRHPNVVAIYDYHAGSVGDSPAFIVMEWLEGASLRGIQYKI